MHEMSLAIGLIEQIQEDAQPTPLGGAFGVVAASTGQNSGARDTHPPPSFQQVRQQISIMQDDDQQGRGGRCCRGLFHGELLWEQELDSHPSLASILHLDRLPGIAIDLLGGVQ